MDLNEEKKRLETCAHDGVYSEGVNAVTNRYAFGIFKRWFRPSSVLELGCGDGNTTRLLMDAFPDVTTVDGSQALVNKVKAEFPSLNIQCKLFEEYEPLRPFSTIILNHTIEHVLDPTELLRRAKQWLTVDGVICAAVPNADSLHRQAAVLMGMLPKRSALTPNDVRGGHRRVSTRAEFREMFDVAGLKVIHEGGYWLKPVSNGQVDRDWTEDMVDAYMQLGEQYPDIASEMYIIAEKYT